MDSTELIALGGDPGLTFLNSTAAPAKQRLELICDGSSYLTWLRQADLIDDTDTDEIHRRFDAGALDSVAAEARQLREWLRPVVTTWATAPDRTLPHPAVDRCNEILATDHRYGALRHDSRTGRTEWTERRAWSTPRQLLVPPIAAIAHLLATGDHGLVRKCESPACTLWFYDRTKSHRRRWCSMAVCGNREKARNHRRRAAAR
ncbi:MAG TPA: CGNR zinc finger domain-containing protein [Pseudonocardiaceae bacterium]|nr:CGNR zinc finger domain-containing protein [Pseudonocardiaceae bacterium]